MQSVVFWRAVGVLVVACVARSQPAAAASFDCAKAVSPRERAVCADPQLSSADEKVAALYAAALTRLSPVGSALLRTAQRRWLKFVDHACMQTTRTVTDEVRSGCLHRAYDDRIADLAVAVVAVGPFTFERIDDYSVSYQVKPEPDFLPLARHQVTDARIDRPLDGMAARWNAKVLNENDGRHYCDGGDGDTWLTSKVVFANARLISLETEFTSYCHGSPHAYGWSVANTLVLGTRIRPLVPSDLFGAGTRWSDRLSTLVLAAAKSEAIAQGSDVSDARMTPAIASAVADVKFWKLGTDGLTMVFDGGDLATEYRFRPSILIPWSKLSDVLAPNALAP